MKRILSEEERTTAFRPWESIILSVLAIVNFAYGFYLKKKGQNSSSRILGILLALGPVALLVLWEIYATMQAAETLNL